MSSPPSPTAWPAPARVYPCPVPRSPLSLRGWQPRGLARKRKRAERRKPNLSAHKAGCKTRSPSSSLPALLPLPAMSPLSCPKIVGAEGLRGERGRRTAFPQALLVPAGDTQTASWHQILARRAGTQAPCLFFLEHGSSAGTPSPARSQCRPDRRAQLRAARKMGESHKSHRGSRGDGEGKARGRAAAQLHRACGTGQDGLGSHRPHLLPCREPHGAHFCPPPPPAEVCGLHL